MILFAIWKSLDPNKIPFSKKNRSKDKNLLPGTFNPFKQVKITFQTFQTFQTSNFKLQTFKLGTRNSELGTLQSHLTVNKFQNYLSNLRRLSTMLYWFNFGLFLVRNFKSIKSDITSIYLSLRIHFSYKRSDFIMIYK